MSVSASILKGIVTDLREIVVRYERGEDMSRLRIDLDRWKRRAIASLSRIVPSEDLESFVRMSTEPHWARAEEGHDPISPVLHEHGIYLESLIVDMRANPDSYGERVVRQAQPTRAATAASPAQSLPLPQKVTLAWLLEHVPVKLWIAFTGILIAAFALGARIGMIPDVVRWLGPLIGVEVPNPDGQ